MLTIKTAHLKLFQKFKYKLYKLRYIHSICSTTIILYYRKERVDSKVYKAQNRKDAHEKTSLIPHTGAS